MSQSFLPSILGILSALDFQTRMMRTQTSTVDPAKKSPDEPESRQVRRARERREAKERSRKGGA